MRSWKHPDKKKPQIYKIWKIVCEKNIISRYFNYRKQVEKNRKLSGNKYKSGTMTEGNEQRRFHGTSS